jgi:3-oxoacyl-[acyl-carrier protein] reductase
MRMLEGTTALVTGGSRGIGRAICMRLATEGANIVLHYNRNQQAAQEVVAAIEGDVKLVHANLASPEEIQKMFDEMRHLRIHFLINNAGIWKGTPLGSSPSELVDEILDTNLKGPFWVTQCALSILQEGGRIIRSW